MWGYDRSFKFTPTQYICINTFINDRCLIWCFCFHLHIMFDKKERERLDLYFDKGFVKKKMSTLSLGAFHSFIEFFCADKC